MRRHTLVASGVVLGALVAALASCLACSETNAPVTDGGSDAGAGADASGADAGSDARAPLDGGSDGGDAGAPDGGPPNLEVELSLETISTAPCADWAVMSDARPRALPSDATARQLWRWRAYDDPVYLASGLVNTYLDGGPSIGPDGHLYIIGPERDRVMSVTRAGRMRWLSEAVGGLLHPTVAIAPDGGLYVGQAVEGGPWNLLRFSGEGELEGATAVGGPYDSALTEAISSITIGPGGMVYVAAPSGRLVATCRGERAIWVLTARYASSGRPAGGHFVVCDADGALWLSGTGAFAEVFRLAADGRTIATIREAESDGVLSLRGLAAGRALFSAARSDYTRYWGRLWDDGAFVGGFPEQEHQTGYRLDPTGAVWQATRRPPEPGAYTFSRWVDGAEQWRVDRNVIEPFGYPGAWGADGSRIEGRLGGGLRRVLPSAEEAWGHPFVPVGGPTAAYYSINLDVDGVAYVESGGDIYAFQTDVLPPAEPGCWDYGCNRRRNNWVGSP
jgi:hypothetical protein